MIEPLPPRPSNIPSFSTILTLTYCGSWRHQHWDEYVTFPSPGIRGDIKIPLLKLVTICRKTSNVCWWSFVDQLHLHHMLGSKVTVVTTASCCYTILGNVFFVKWRQQSPTFCKGLNISGMQAFLRLPTEFDNLLLNAAGYFDVSPKFTVHNRVSQT